MQKYCIKNLYQQFPWLLEFALAFRNTQSHCNEETNISSAISQPET